jgi:hypothetical protein
MSIQDYFDNEGYEQELSIEASKRKFQTSIILKQDPQKSGVLSFLEKVEPSSPEPLATLPPKTMRPSIRQGNK